MTTVRAFAASGLADGALTTATDGGDPFDSVGTGQTIAGGKISIPNTAAIPFGKWSGLSLDAFSFSVPFTCPAAGTAASPIIYFTKSTGTRIGSITLSSARQLQFRDGAANSPQSTSPVLTQGGEYRIAPWRVAGSAAVAWRIYAPDGSLFHSGTPTIMGATDLLAGIQFGRQAVQQFGGVALFGDIILTDVGAEVDLAPPTSQWCRIGPGGVEIPVSAGRVRSGVVIPVATELVHIAPPPGDFTRIASEHPFASDAMSNTSLKVGATLEVVTDLKTNTLLNGLSATGGKIASQVNHTSYTYPIYPNATIDVTTADPLTTVTNVKTGKVYSGIERPRIPLLATPSSGTDAPMIVVQPDEFTSWEFYKVKRIYSGTTPTAAITTEYVNIVDLRGNGLQAGSRASGIAAIIGEIRAKELKALRMPHVLAMAICATQMKATPSAADGDRMYNSAGKAIAVFPARLQDTQVGANIYSGGEDVGSTPGAGIPMGSLFAIDPTVTAAQTGITSPEGGALLWTLQNYGAAVLLQALYVTLFAEPDCNAAAVARLKADWKLLRPFLRRVKNNTRTSIGGIGAPRQPFPPDLLVNQP